VDKLISSMYSLEKVSQAERKQYQEAKLRHIIDHAYKNAPAVKSRFDGAGIRPADIKSIADLEKIPVLRKDELVDLQKLSPPFGGLTTVSWETMGRVYVSPGPIYDPHRKDDKFWESLVAIVKAMGFRAGDVVINTWAYHLVPAGLIFDEALMRVGATVIPTGVGNTELQARIMHDLKVTGFCGTTGFFMNIIEKAEEMGYDIRKDFNLRIANIGGEMGGGSIRSVVEQKYGIETRDVYATADLSFLAYECECKSGMHINENIILEICDPETGKVLPSDSVGEIVATPFDEVYPLIRFGTGDLSSMTCDACACGRTSPRLSRILGRVGDAVRIRGMFLHPKQTNEVMAKYKEIANYQVTVTRPTTRDEMVLQIELCEQTKEKEDWKENLRKDFQNICRLKCDKVETVSSGTIAKDAKKILDKRVY